MTELTRLSATRLVERLRRREVSAEEVAAAHLRRIRERDPLIRAFAALDPDRVLERARQLDRGEITGPLHGLPVAVKDVIDTAALPTEYGSPIYRGHRPDADAVCVAAAERAGAIVLGKTVTTEFATFKPAATVNPRHHAHTPGGSSSGSAAGVADFMAPLAFGTQTFGSVIRPASYCGVVGYKPTFGWISRQGAKPLASSLDTVGVFARTIRDAALLAGAVAGKAQLLALPALRSAPRIGLCRTFEWDAVEPSGRSAFAAAARLLSDAGAEVVEVDLPREFSALGTAIENIYGYEIARSLATERQAHAELLSESLRESIDAGARVTPERYELGMRIAAACRTAFPSVMADCDVLLTPSTTGEAPESLDTTGSPIMNRLWTLLHVPAVNVPGLDGPNALPIGMQIVGLKGRDVMTLAAAEWIHGRLSRASE